MGRTSISLRLKKLEDGCSKKVLKFPQGFEITERSCLQEVLLVSQDDGDTETLDHSVAGTLEDDFLLKGWMNAQAFGTL